MNTAIITSLLDTDAYKLHMQQAVWHFYPQTQVTLELNCRNNEDLLPYLEQIKTQVNLLQQVQLTENEAQYLSQLDIYKPDYLAYLTDFRFEPKQVSFSKENNKLSIRVKGPWHQVILWEIPILAIISEIRNATVHPDKGTVQAKGRLQEKITLLQEQDLADFKLIEFGTRRRFSKELQKYVLTTLAEALPQQLVGTSNYWLAKELNMTPIGTQAHEWFQGHQQLAEKLEDSQKMALTSWLREYPNKLGIALTDCITMDAFLRDFDAELATLYTGLRQDSGDPIGWGEKAINHYQALAIDPMSKMLVFSDALNIPKAIEIFRHFQHRTQTSFGIGTNLTCDIPAVDPMNIVLKMTECNGLPVAKISDSPGKTLCHDVSYISRLKKAFCLPL